MLSSTNYHLPSTVMEGLAAYSEGRADLDVAISRAQFPAVLGQLAVITDPSNDIHFDVKTEGYHRMLMIDDHTREPGDVTIDR